MDRSWFNFLAGVWCFIDRQINREMVEYHQSYTSLFTDWRFYFEETGLFMAYARNDLQPRLCPAPANLKEDISS